MKNSYCILSWTILVFSCTNDINPVPDIEISNEQVRSVVRDGFTYINSNFNSSTNSLDNLKSTVFDFGETNSFISQDPIVYRSIITEQLGSFPNGRLQVDDMDLSIDQKVYIEKYEMLFENSNSLDELEESINNLILEAEGVLSADEFLPIQLMAVLSLESARYGFQNGPILTSGGRIEEWNWKSFGKAAGLGALAGLLNGAKTGTIQGALIGAAGGALIGGIVYTVAEL